MSEDRLPARIGRALGDLDRRQTLHSIAQRLRQRLPGDAELGDPLSVSGTRPPQAVAKMLTEVGTSRPSATRELGLAAVQVWQALSEAQGRGRGDEEVAIVFTDLVGYSSWALEAGDDAAIDLLRTVGRAVEPLVGANGGRLVKRLGDGLMTVFVDTERAVDFAYGACRAVDVLEVAGHRPRLRAGVHVGRPRRLGGDFYGVDVNIAARVGEAAKGGQVLVSEPAFDMLDPQRVTGGRSKPLRAAGAPKGLRVRSVEPVPEPPPAI